MPDRNFTLVIGASSNPVRYSNMAINRLVEHNQPVYAIGLRDEEIRGVKVQTGFPELEHVETVTLYINPRRQPQYYDYIIGLQPKRIIFNPGTENRELEQMARENGIEAIEACTLVMLSTNQFELERG